MHSRLLLFILLLINVTLLGRGTITIIFRPFPDLNSDQYTRFWLKPGEPLPHKNKYTPISVEGFLGTYAGMLGISTTGGIMTFVRKHAEDVLTIVITTSIKPVMKIPGIIDHLEVSPGTTYQAYHVTQFKDEETGVPLWEVQKVTLPENAIPLKGVVLFADPSTIRVPLGVSISTEGPHLVLPPLYCTQPAEYNTMPFLEISSVISPQSVTVLSNPGEWRTKRLLYNT